MSLSPGASGMAGGFADSGANGPNGNGSELFLFL
jgi:hypothetical protein